MNQIVTSVTWQPRRLKKKRKKRKTLWLSNPCIIPLMSPNKPSGLILTLGSAFLGISAQVSRSFWRRWDCILRMIQSVNASQHSWQHVKYILTVVGFPDANIPIQSGKHQRGPAICYLFAHRMWFSCTHVQISDSGTTFSIWPAFYLSSCTHTLAISSLVVVSNGSVIKSTALVQQVIRSENTARAALSACVVSSVHTKCQRMRFAEDVRASGEKRERSQREQ